MYSFSFLAHQTVVMYKYVCSFVVYWNIRCYITRFSVASILYSSTSETSYELHRLFCSFHLLLWQKKVFNMIASINLSTIVIKLYDRVAFSYLVRFAWWQLRESNWTVLFNWQTPIRDTMKFKVTDSLRKRREKDMFIYFSQFIIFLFLCIVSIRDRLPKDEKGNIKQKNPILI